MDLLDYIILPGLLFIKIDVIINKTCYFDDTFRYLDLNTILTYFFYFFIVLEVNH
jgi:hypothetical protein